MRYILENTGMSQSELARKIGVKPQAIQFLCSGKARKTRFSHEIAAATGFNSEWISTGKGPKRKNDGSESPTGYMNSDLQPGPDLPEKFRRIPVIGTAQLGPNGYWCETGYPVGKGEGYIEFVSRDPDAYALRVQGDSMSPTIRSGWFVIVEPNVERIPGSYVVVCTRDERCMVKEFLFERNGEFAFASVNDSYGRMTLRQDDIEKIHSVSAIVTPQKFMPW